MVDQALAEGWPFRAAVADCLYGEHHGFTRGLEQRGVPFVVALKPSHAWWAPVEAIGAVWEVAAAGDWVSPERPGAWQPIIRHDRDDQTATWWALEGVAGPYGPDRGRRLVIATVDPATVPETATWYLATTLPLAEADLAEVVRLYGLRNWVEQQYKQVKHSLGWSQYQVRSDRAMRRHWALVQCAFAFCWWAESHAPPARREAELTGTGGRPAERGEKGAASRSGVAPTVALLARGAAAGARLAGARVGPVALLARVERPTPTHRAPGAPRFAGTRVPAQPL